jgi:hypothetical protein
MAHVALAERFTTMQSRSVRRPFIALVMLAMAVGCSSTTGKPAPSSSAPGPSSPLPTSTSSVPTGSQTVAAACPDGALSVRFLGTTAAAGTVLGTFSLANVTTSDCVVNGYPSVGASAGGASLAIRTSNGITVPGFGGYGVSPQAIDLKPAGQAKFALVWSEVRTPCLSPSEWDVKMPGASRSISVPIPSPTSVSICSPVQVSPVMPAS